MTTPFDWKTLPAIVGGIILAAILSEPKITITFIALMFFDWLSGSFNAWAKNGPGVDSERSRKGMVKKAQMLLFWGAARALESSVPIVIDMPVAGPMTLSGAVASLFACTEFISLIENVGLAGVKLPAFLTERFTKLRQLTGDVPPQ
jgi:phage-related holin